MANVNVDHDMFTHDLVLTWRTLNVAGHGFDTLAVIRVSPAEQLQFVADVSRRAAEALTDAARAVEAGDCSTCGNVRLVTVPHPHRGTEQVYCPDCRGRFDAAVPFGSVPTIRTPSEG